MLMPGRHARIFQIQVCFVNAKVTRPVNLIRNAQWRFNMHATEDDYRRSMSRAEKIRHAMEAANISKTGQGPRA